MKIVYCHNWFLDYRIPVFLHLKKLTNDNFFVLYNSDNVPTRISLKLKKQLGLKAIEFKNEKTFYLKKNYSGDFANSTFKLQYQPGLYKKLKELKPDILIGEGFFRWGLTNLTYKIFNKTKYIMLYERTFHTERNIPFFLTTLRKIILNLIDSVGCNGIQTKEYIRSLGYDMSKTFDKHMVADTSSLISKSVDYNRINEIKDMYSIKGKVFLYCGQMVKRKGVDLLINSWIKFKNKNQTDSSLVLIGSGESLNNFKKLANHSSIKFIPKVDFDEIHNYFGIADIFIILTREDNGSIVLPEAMAMGLPVITSIFNGNHNEYVNSKNGWVVNPLNVEEVVKTMEDAYYSNNLKEMGQASLEIVKNFTPKIAASKIYNNCKNLLQ